MSRPPRPYPSTEVSNGLPVHDGVLQVFAPSYRELVELQTQLATSELEQQPSGAEGDFATSLFDMSAMVAHLLGVYQNFYGGEAFLGTARTQRSLVRHGRRLGYTADAGVAATGVVAIEIKTDLSGQLAKGLSLLSAPSGEQTTENYQTLESRDVDSRWNAIELVDATIPTATLTASTSELRVQGIGLGLSPDERVLLVGGDFAAPLTIAAVGEDPDREVTALSFTQMIPVALTNLPPGSYRVLAKPSLSLRLFGWDADPRVFPPRELQAGEGFVSGSATPSDPDAGTKLTTGSTQVTTFPPVFGYQVFGQSGTAEAPAVADMYLSQALNTELTGNWVLRLQDGVPTPYFVRHQSAVSVSFVREQEQLVEITLPQAEGSAPEDGDPLTTQTTQFNQQWISASTTRIRVSTTATPSATLISRSAHDVRSRWLSNWTLSLLLQQTIPNPELVSAASELRLSGALSGLSPGMLLVLATHDRRAAQLVELSRVDVRAATALAGAETVIAWEDRGPPPENHKFSKSDLVVLGNIVRISHGKAVDEVLGDSDGVTPFQRLALKKSPLTRLPDATGATPDLEIRIDNVLWTGVDDFSDSGPEDRHYLLQSDESRRSEILFGDGRKGAIPPAGRRHVRAHYRIGLGQVGNVAAGRLTRLEAAHPLIRSVSNPIAVSGGTEPARVDQVRLEATRFIRTFDRAVSTTDYADLALLFPGVARARATSDPATGVELVVADTTGRGLGNTEPLLNFLLPRCDRSVPLRLRNPEPVELYMQVKVEYDPAFFDWQVEQAVREALSGGDDDTPGLFTFQGRELGQSAFLSRAYQAINGAAGVLFSQIVHFALVKGGDEFRQIRDVLQVAPHQWLSLPAANLTVGSSIATEQ